MGDATINATHYLIHFIMKKLVLKIEAVEDRTAPIMFTERNLPGACCCTCCCCCCSSQEAEEIHNNIEMNLVNTITELGGGGPSVLNFDPYYEAAMYDCIELLGNSPEDILGYNNIWDAVYNEYMTKEY